MFSYLQMPFLQALGYAIANSLWQLFLLWLMVILINGMMRQSSHVKYITALSAQIAGFVWFITTFQFYYRHCHAASVQAEQLMLKHEVVYTQSLMTGSVLSYLVKAEEMLPYLSVAYLLLLLLLVTKWIKNFQQTRQLASNGLQAAERNWQTFVNNTADQLGILQNVTVYLSAIAKSPLTIGYIKPIILLPLASVNQLTTEQLEAVLLHELAHIKRADYIINMLVSIVEIVLFFNPFTRLLSSLIKEERENCCDDWVLQFQYNAAMYAEALLRLAYTQKNGLPMNAASQKKGELLQRVKRIVQPGEKSFNYKHQVVALLLLTGLFFSVAWLQPSENNYSPKQVSNVKEIHQKIVVTPLTAELDNPFFNVASLFSKSLQEDVNQSLTDINKTMSDSIARASITIAQKAMQQAAPAVITTVSSGNWQKIVQNATEAAQKSLQNIDWKSIQENVSQEVDSSFNLQSLQEAALPKTKEVSGINEDLTAAKEQLEELKNQKINLYFDNDDLQQITSNALASVKKFNFKAIQDSILKSADVINKLASEQKMQLLINKKRHQEFNKKEMENLKRSKEAMMNHLPPAPVLPPLPPNDNKTLVTINEPAIAEVAGSSWTFSKPVFRIMNDNLVHAKTIRIISKDDSSTINIVIEIRQ